jgi:hypothetical protein
MGNPEPLLRSRAAELWTVDYDTLVRIEVPSWRVRGRLRVEDTGHARVQRFAGHFAFDADEQRCIVGRPYSGDVLVVRTRDLRAVGSLPLGGQPLDVALLQGDVVVARDWQTGALLQGTLKPA